MWLEELVWLWGPLAGGVGLWGFWTLMSLRVEVHALRERIGQLEGGRLSNDCAGRKVA